MSSFSDFWDYARRAFGCRQRRDSRCAAPLYAVGCRHYASGYPALLAGGVPQRYQTGRK